MDTEFPMSRDERGSKDRGDFLSFSLLHAVLYFTHTDGLGAHRHDINRRLLRLSRCKRVVNHGDLSFRSNSRRERAEWRSSTVNNIGRAESLQVSEMAL